MAANQSDRIRQRIADEIARHDAVNGKMQRDEQLEAHDLIASRGYAVLLHPSGRVVQCTTLAAFMAVQRGMSLPIQDAEAYQPEPEPKRAPAPRRGPRTPRR